ncbi:MAG: propionyl-CoA synthetase, partial [Glaciecola sp.]
MRSEQFTIVCCYLPQCGHLQLFKKVNRMSYLTEYQASINSPENFWADKAKRLPWFTAPEKILSDDENGIKRWFADAQMNTCYMALDHHVAQGRGEQIALIYDSPVTDTKM